MQIPEDVSELLRRLATRGWKSDNEAYITEVAQRLCAAYGIRIDSTAPTDYFLYTGHIQLGRNTAALVEWLDMNRLGQIVSGPNDSKILVALLGNLSEERAQYHYDLLITAKRDENMWKNLISISEGSRGSEYYMTSEAMQRQSRPETPKTKAVSWLKEQLQHAKDVTYALAHQAVAEGMGLGTPGAQT